MQSLATPITYLYRFDPVFTKTLRYIQGTTFYLLQGIHVFFFLFFSFTSQLVGPISPQENMAAYSCVREADRYALP